MVCNRLKILVYMDSRRSTETLHDVMIGKVIFKHKQEPYGISQLKGMAASDDSKTAGINSGLVRES